MAHHLGFTESGSKMVLWSAQRADKSNFNKRRKGDVFKANAVMKRRRVTD